MRVRTATLSYRGRDFVFGTKPALGGARGAWVLEDVTGWFGGVDVRAEATDRLGHGQFMQRAFRGSRGLTLQATYIAREPDERLELERALSGMLYDGDYGTLTCETDLKLSCQVRLDGEVGIVENGIFGVELQVPLIATDPWLYGEPRQDTMRPQGEGVGLIFPTFMSRATEADTATNVAISDNLAAGRYVIGSGNALSAGGGATYETSDVWGDEDESSLKINPGTSSSSAVYVADVRTSSSQLAGCQVVARAKFHMEEAQADDPAGTDNAVPRSLNIVARPTAGSATDSNYGYMWSNQPPNEAGTYDVTARFMAPDDATVYPQWLIRLMNGSTETPVWWDSLTVEAVKTPKAENVTEPFTLGLPPTRVLQGLERDWESGDWYTTQRADTATDDLWVQRLDSNGVLLETMLIPGGGHGGDIAIERDEDGVIWWWGEWASNNPRRVRIRFRDGTVTPEDPDVIAVSQQQSYVRYSIWDGLLCERIPVTVNGVGVAKYRLFDLNDYKENNLAGTAVPIKELTRPEPTYYAYQGFIATGSYIYENGGGTRKDPTAIHRFNWDDANEHKIVRTSGFGVDTSGYDESEGICIDPVSGEIVFGKATGAAGARKAQALRVTPDQFDYEPKYVAGLEVGPLSFGTAVNDSSTIRNDGNADAYPTYTVVGDFPGGVTITQNKGRVTYPWPLVKSAPLRIEASGSAWIGDSNVTAQLTARDFDKFKVGPGSTASPRLSALQTGSGYLNVTVRDTYI